MHDLAEAIAITEPGHDIFIEHLVGFAQGIASRMQLNAHAATSLVLTGFIVFRLTLFAFVSLVVCRLGGFALAHSQKDPIQLILVNGECCVKHRSQCFLIQTFSGAERLSHR